jgi:hypothetical protein
MCPTVLHCGKPGDTIAFGSQLVRLAASADPDPTAKVYRLKFITPSKKVAKGRPMPFEVAARLFAFISRGNYRGNTSNALAPVKTVSAR